MTRTAGAASPDGEPRVVLIGKPGCHLCDTAREVVTSVTTELGIGWRELSILEDPELDERYREQIPVVLVDGEPHDYWRVDDRRLRAALAGPALTGNEGGSRASTRGNSRPGSRFGRWLRR